ncbi:thioredoxin-like protein [Rhizoclosmatium globosum]|uniref:Glutathione peroxidase n=1 Tax=Rhizoclosmatium globosum TaxID=329046 RepID=A0A1Y2CYB0_9FUNG|nr:thioredoxin-like protein [Rhizoclosmatium globosum]|eukprot:ORY51834.1 thioredoxin-like protein [Rhizoclosmatium globosum]
MPKLADILVNDIKGKAFPLGREIDGKVVLFVNVASKCGFTSQYDGLEALYKRYKDQGLLIIGVPTNQFYQEPTDGDSCRLRFGVSFPILEKMNVNGNDAHPLYRHLKSEKPHLLIGGGVIWNFEKFMVNRKGQVVDRFISLYSPEVLEVYVKKELGVSKSSSLVADVLHVIYPLLAPVFFGVISLLETVQGHDYVKKFMQ